LETTLLASRLISRSLHEATNICELGLLAERRSA